MSLPDAAVSVVPPPHRTALTRSSDGGATADAGWRWAPFFMAAEVRLTVGVPRPRSGSVYVAVLPRQVGATSYGGRAIIAANGTVQAQVLRVGTTLGAVTVPGLAFTTGDRLWVRTRATGVSPTTVGVKVWEVGTAEPAAWQVEVTDATPALQTTGGIGLVAYLGANAQPTPVVVTLDDLTARRSG